MTTHKEEIDIPDGWTYTPQWGQAEDPGLRTISIVLYRVPHPEPPIKPCPCCGGDVQVERQAGGSFKTNHISKGECPISFWTGIRYPTRLAAIEAANRRAKT